MKIKRIIVMLSIRIIVFIFLLFWIGIFKSLIIFGESHLYEPNQFVAIIELGIISLSCGWFAVKSFKELSNELTHKEDKVKGK